MNTSINCSTKPPASRHSITNGSSSRSLTTRSEMFIRLTIDRLLIRWSKNAKWGRPYIMSQRNVESSIGKRHVSEICVVSKLRITSGDGDIICGWSPHDSSINLLIDFLLAGHSEIEDPISVGHSLLCSAGSILRHEGQHKDLQARLHRQREREYFQLVTFTRCRWNESIVSS